MQQKQLVFLMLLIVSICLSAQNFDLVSESFSSIDLNSSSKPTITDLDGDGLLDLLIGTGLGDIYHYEQNTPNGIEFTYVTDSFNSIDMVNNATPAFVDIDGDNLLDLIVGGQNGTLSHFKQDSANSLVFNLITENFNSIDVGNNSAPTFTDIDNDNLIDMVVGNGSGELVHYEQDAEYSLSFSLINLQLSNIDVINTASPNFRDIDYDGLLDLIVGRYSNDQVSLEHYEQVTENSDSFTLVNSALIPYIYGPQTIVPFTYDIDNDGYVDLLVGRSDGTIMHYESDSYQFALTYEDENILQYDVGEVKPTICDWDGDGLMNISMGYVGGAIKTSECSYSNPSFFSSISTHINISDICDGSAPTIADIDGDYLLDFLIGKDDGQIFHYEQDATNSYNFSEIDNNFNSIDVGSKSAPTLTDLDNDGLLDLLIGKHTGEINHYEQDSSFSLNFILVTTNFNFIDVGNDSTPTFGDIDDDELLDLLVGNLLGEISHYEQDENDPLIFHHITSNLENIDVGDKSAPVFAKLGTSNQNSNDKLDLLIGSYAGNIRWYQVLSPSVNLECINTGIVSDITTDSATLSGELLDANSGLVTQCGVCYSSSDTDPELLNDSKKIMGQSIGEFSGSINGLQPGIWYYYKAYSITTLGVWYSEVDSFKTSSVEATLSTNSVTAVTGFTATSGGNITFNGGEPVTVRGVCWSTSQNPDIINNSFTNDGSGSGSFDSSLTELTPATTYYVRAYATNSIGTSYGDEESFDTDDTPEVITDSVSEITDSSATCGGDVTANNGEQVSAKGVCWSTSQNPDIENNDLTNDGSGVGLFVSSLTGLSQGTTYYVRAYATNSVGTSYGDEVSFTSDDEPSVATVQVSEIDLTSAVCEGNVISDNGDSVSERGICWSESSNPTISDNIVASGSGPGEFNSNITSLQADTFYFVRAYATNSIGTGYGEEIQFATPFNVRNMLDFDGNDDYVSVPLILPADGTIEFWVKPNYINDGCAWFAESTSDYGWRCAFVDNALRIYFGNTVLLYNDILENKYQHIAITWDQYTYFGTSYISMQLIVNGNLVDSSVSDMYNFPDSTMLLGYYPTNSSELDAQLDDFRIWDTVRTSTQIQEKMFQDIDPSETNLMCYFDFDVNSGSSLPDRTGNGYTGTLHNFQDDPWLISQVPIGESGVSLRTNSPVTIGDTGKSISVTITSVVDNVNNLGAYLVGDGLEIIDGEIFPYGISERPNIFWGIHEFGDCTTEIEIDYSNVNFTRAENVKLLKRENADSDWSILSENVVHSIQNNTFMISDNTTYLEYTVAKGEFVDSYAGSCLDFDGLDDLVSFGNDTSLDIEDNITVEGWMKTGELNSNRRILDKGDISLLFWDDNLESISGKGLQVNLPGPNTGWWEFQYDMNYNEWYHFAWTFSSNGDLKAYINGENVRTENFPGSITLNTENLILASDQGYDPYFGAIEELRIWNDVRSEEELRENMHLPLNGIESGLVSYWQFNAGSGLTTADMISNNQGTLTNMDEDDWIDSTIPFGDGVSDSQTEISGTVEFLDTDVSMYFNSHSSAEITVTRIDTIPNINPTEPDVVFDSQYWVVNRFGYGTFDADLTFTINEDLTDEDVSNPSQIKLYTRSSAADTDWIQLTTASSINAANKEVLFNGITGFSQFIIGRSAPQTLDFPLNLTIEIIGTNVHLSWDAVTGANSYKIYASDDPYATDWGMEIASVSGTSWNTTVFEEKKFYHVIASTDSMIRNVSKRSFRTRRKSAFRK
jgi:hypothetical protein